MKPVKWDGEDVFPSKIVCIGRNYVEHIKELGNEIPKEPVIFIKPNSAISTDIHAGESDEIHYEAEISFLIHTGKLAAIGFGLDLTKRDLQSRLKSKGLPWERSKAFDGAAVFSEFFTFTDQTDNLRLELFINDRLIQQGGCQLMIYKPAEIMAEVESFLTLQDADLIMTGTPAGVGVVHAGDRFTGRIYDNEKQMVEASWVVK